MSTCPNGYPDYTVVLYLKTAELHLVVIAEHEEAAELAGKHLAKQLDATFAYVVTPEPPTHQP